MITVTSPILPDLREYEDMLKDIWKTKQLTNNGVYHRELEKVLAEYLKVPYLSLFTNGTLPLLAALKILDIRGEVITTPYSFVATSHVLWWNNIQPVFVDIDPKTGNIDPDKIERAISSKTMAIMPVHVYGSPCDTEKIQAIADKYGLKVIYDAAHAFGVEVNGSSILKEGDMSTLSFHATKIYNTVEGGALICKDAETKSRVDYLRNFGIASETQVVGVGINCKMDELRAAYGLLNLKQVDNAIDVCKKVTIQYRNNLNKVKGISFLNDMPMVRYNYSYFPIFINEKEYGMTRDELYFRLKEKDILGRRYFYPLISDVSPYSDLASASPANLPVAQRIANSVICLPIHSSLTIEDVDKIINTIQCNNKKG